MAQAPAPAGVGAPPSFRISKSPQSKSTSSAEITDPLYDQIRVLTLPVWRCPSDSVELPLFPVQSSGGTTITQVAFANYVGVAGTDEVSVYPDTGTGVLFRNKSIAIKQITDGLSHTLMVGERDSHKSPQTTWVGASPTPSSHR